MCDSSSETVLVDGVMSIPIIPRKVSRSADWRASYTGIGLCHAMAPNRAGVIDHIGADLGTARYAAAGTSAQLFRARGRKRSHHGAVGWRRAPWSRLHNHRPLEHDRRLVWR